MTDTIARGIAARALTFASKVFSPAEKPSAEESAQARANLGAGSQVLEGYLLVDLASVRVPASVRLIRCLGAVAVDDAFAGMDLVYDEAVNAAYVAANPQTAVVTADGRGFREAKQSASRRFKALYDTRHLFDYLTYRQQRAVLTNDYTSWSKADLTGLRLAIQGAFNDAQGRCLIIPPSSYIKLNGPLRVSSRVAIKSPLGSMNVYLPFTDPKDPGAALGATIFYPDLSIDWRSEWPLRGLIETTNFIWPREIISGSSTKPDYWGFSVIDGIHARGNFDRDLYEAHPERVPAYGFVIWCPNDHAKLERCSAWNFGRQNFLIGGTMATGQLRDCTSWGAGENQDTVFGDTVTRASAPFADAVTVFAPVNWVIGSVGGTLSQVQIECASAAPLNSLAVGQQLAIDVGGGNSLTVTISGLLTATNLIDQRSRIAGVKSTQRYVRTIQLSADLTQRLLGRVFHWGFAFTNHPDRNFAPGIVGRDGGQQSGGGCWMYGVGGDYSRDAFIGADGAQVIGIFGAKAENHPTFLDVTGGGVGGGKARICVFGSRVEHGTAATGTVEDYGVIRITGTARPSVSWQGVAPLNHTTFLADWTPLAVGNGGTQGSDARQYSHMTIGTNILTVDQVGGGVPGGYCIDGSEFAVLPQTRTANLFVGGTGQLNITNGLGGAASNYNLMIEMRFQPTRTLRMSMRNGLHDVLTVDQFDGSGANGTRLYARNPTTFQMEPALQVDPAGTRYNLRGKPVAFSTGAPVATPTISGSRAGNPALASTTVALASLGLATDASTAS